jgi:Flp pilus assembly protein TadG
LKEFSSIRRIKDTRGQGLVEFAIVAFLLIMVILGVVEMCRMVLVYTTVANGARIGVRYAIVHGSDSPVTTSQIQSVVNSYLGRGTVSTTTAACPPLPSGAACVKVEYPDPVGAATSGCTDPGCRVTVTVSYPYDPFTSYFPLSVTLGSTSQGVITF